MAGYNLGDTLYDYDSGTAITLQQGQNGMEWSKPVPIPKASTGKAPPTPPTVGVGEDLAKTAGPATERALTGMVTAPTTLADLAAKGVSAAAPHVLPEGAASSVQGAADATSKFLKPFTYPGVQGKIEGEYNKVHPGSPLYYPQTSPGQFLEAGIGGAAAAAGGPVGMARALTGSVGNLGRRLATGIGGSLAGEAGGQVADEAGFSNLAGVARGVGDIAGAKGAAEGPRKAITPYPAVSQPHIDMANLLAKQPGDITTAGQFTGNPKLLQREGNLAPHAPAPYNNLGTMQPQADTSSMMSTMGVPPATTAKSGATRPVIKAGKDAIGANIDTLEKNTMSRFDPDFHQSLKDITDDYYKAKNALPNSVTPSPVEKRISEIYQSGPKSIRAGMTGTDYSQMRQDLNKEIGGYVSGKNADPLVVKSLSQLRDALGDNMERSLQASGSPYAGKWQEAFDQYESAKTLEKAAKNPKAAGILGPATVNASAKNPDSVIAQLSRAQSTVHKPLPEPKEPRGLLSTGLGAATSWMTGGSPAEGALAGTVSGPTIQKSLLRNPVTAGAFFSPRVQEYLRNQKWQPSKNTTMDPATVARLLALQKTQSTPQEP